MTFKKERNLLTIAMLLGTCLTLLLASFTAFADFAEKSGQAEREVLRLHILPNSDSAEDQALKENLRDFIIADMQMRFAGTATLDEAIRLTELHLPEIQKNAEAFVRSQGFTYDVEVSQVKMFFTTRVYENITMPAGNYAALRITIGAGEGQNWWCVMFPPLCLPAVTSRQELPAAEPYFSPEVSEILESGGGRIEVRFKLLEWWRRVFG